MNNIATRGDLESMLLDKAAEPKVLPLSLLEKITNGFSHEMQIGRAGSSMLYKAMLQNGAIVVKRTYMCQNKFLQEIECLMKLKHQNIVRFLGYCAETQGYMDKEKMVIVNKPHRFLCFEYLPSGSLDYYIKDSSGWLEWRKQCTIIKGIWEGLNYLHQQNIMHIDLKPSNILLHENMVPKIADFGLSRGYMTQRFTGHVLYSLGIIIFEILTGRMGHLVLEKDKLSMQMRSKPHHLSRESKGSTPNHLTLQYLKDITNNFCAENILGRGGFSVVYKGELQSGELVAVKKLVRAAPSLQKQFENEVNLLMKLDHPNIVRPVDYCYETQYFHKPHRGETVFARNTESLVCLEYLPNGSLDHYISGASSGLDWHTRWEIINGISTGLCYLHEQSKYPIIHLDLKPSNILLDKNMIPKIADFGLARSFDEKQANSGAMTSGTLGYMAPEYLLGIFTPMSDIFSLGVIMMEVITGHKDYPYDIRESSEGFIASELQKWRNVLTKELYPMLLQIEGCIGISLKCVDPERQKRPTIRKIIDMLEVLKGSDKRI